MCVVTDQAAAIGVTAMPTPTTDNISDSWFLWLPWMASWRLADATGVQANPYMRYDFDSKAMRKVQESDTIAVMLENASAGDGCNFLLQFRMLLKLT